MAADAVSQGIAVQAWDPDPARRVDGVIRSSSAIEAIEGATIVLSVNSATAAVGAAESVRSALTRGQIYADLNAAGPDVKRSAADVVRPSGALFADVALMGVVPQHGIGTPALASGPGAAALADAMRPLGMPIEVIGDEVGAAATRKLLRSVFMKGLAATAIETMQAAEAAGCPGWMRGEIETILLGADAALLDRLLTGSEQHATRRVAEMQSAQALLAELGVDPHVSEAAERWLRTLGASGSDVSSQA